MPHDPVLHMLGLARKAGKLELGEEPVGAVCRAHHARLLLLAVDAAPNTHRRAVHFAEAGNVLTMELPFSKEELGFFFGRSSCAMLALTDAGFAASVADKLAARDPFRYGAVAEQLRTKADRMFQRQREKRRHEKNLREGKRKPWAAPPPPPKKAADASPSQSKHHTKPKPPGQGKSAHPGKEGLPPPRAHKPGPGGRRLSGTIPKKRGGFSL